MCKILCLTSHDPAKRDEIITRVWKEMYGTDDGYGAAWLSPDGHIGYHRRSHPWIPEYVLPDFCREKPRTTWEKDKVRFGQSNDIPSDGGFLIIHGRKATGTINVANTHPMLADNAALVHNGVVRSTKHRNVAPGCTCDSEYLLNAFLEGGIEEIENEIEGSYAFMMLLVTGGQSVEGTDAEAGGQVSPLKRTLHIVKDNKVSLECGITRDGAYAFATVDVLLKHVGAEHMGALKDGTMLIFEDKADYKAYQFTPHVYKPTVADTASERIAHGDYDDEEAQAWERLHGGGGISAGGTSHTYPDKPKVTIDPKTWEADEKEIRRLEMEAIINEVSAGV